MENDFPFGNYLIHYKLMTFSKTKVKDQNYRFLTHFGQMSHFYTP